jgi:hypothetical protein
MPNCESALVNILNELLDGAPETGAYVLNAGDIGLLRAIDRISAIDASLIPEGANASVAAHVDHLRYGLSLLNRWTHGEQPFADANWTASWERLHVSPEEWEDLRAALRIEAYAWRDALSRQTGNLNEQEQNGVVGSVVHLAYHLGAIRQIHRALRGPSAKEADEAALNPQQLG